MSKKPSNESGQVLILTAVSLTLLLGVLALAIDVGYMQYKGVQLQTAADSAAIAAGLEDGECGQAVCSNMETAAEQALKEDGITSATIAPTANQCAVPTSTGLAMIINVAPCVLGSKDPNSGNTNMVEVVLTEPQSTFFGAIFGIRSFHLVARAEAGEAYINKPSNSVCVWTGSSQFNSNVTADLGSCGWYDNGGLQTDGNSKVTATGFQYYGTWSPNNCNNSCTWDFSNGSTQPAPVTTSRPDPIAAEIADDQLSVPSQPATSTTASNTTPNSGATLHPGYYSNGVNLNSNVTVNLIPGLYYMNGSINVGSGATLECTGCTGGLGVTLYFTNGTLQMNSTSTVKLAAPSPDALTTSSGATTSVDSTTTNVPNMLVWQPTSNSSGMDVDAGSLSVLSGLIYLPKATLTINSAANLTAIGIDVNDLLLDSGFTIDGSNNLLGSGQTSSTLGSFALAE